MNLIFIAALFLFQPAFPKQPPIDVPPITEEYGPFGYEFCDMGSCHFTEMDPKNKPAWLGATPLKRKTQLTCADKTRFLMTSEDGAKHCILLVVKEGRQ